MFLATHKKQSAALFTKDSPLGWSRPLHSPRHAPVLEIFQKLFSPSCWPQNALISKLQPNLNENMCQRLQWSKQYDSHKVLRSTPSVKSLEKCPNKNYRFFHTRPYEWATNFWGKWSPSENAGSSRSDGTLTGGRGRCRRPSSGRASGGRPSRPSGGAPTRGRMRRRSTAGRRPWPALRSAPNTRTKPAATRRLQKP